MKSHSIFEQRIDFLAPISNVLHQSHDFILLGQLVYVGHLARILEKLYVSLGVYRPPLERLSFLPQYILDREVLVEENLV